MGSALPTEKLDRTNYTSWEYKMHQYLVGQGYWSYIQGAHENQPDSTHANYPAWEQAASRRYSTPIQHNENACTHKGEYSLIL